MQKKYWTLLMYWLLFLGLIVSGKVVSYYQELLSQPAVLISFEAFDKLEKNVSTNLAQYTERVSLVSEQEVALETKKIESEIASVEKGLEKKQKALKIALSRVKKAKPQLTAVVQPKKISEPKIENDGELFAIDNSTPYEQEAFVVSKPQVVSVLSFYKPLEETKELIKDEVKVAVAAVEKKAAPQADEPVFLDYEEEATDEIQEQSFTKVEDQGLKADSPPSLEKVAEYSNQSILPPSPKVTSTTLSPSVQRAIERESQELPQNKAIKKLAPKPAVSKPQIVDTQDDEVAYQNATPVLNTQNTVALNTQIAKKNAFVVEQNDSKLALTALRVELNQNKGMELGQFEFDMAYDSQERWDSEWSLKSNAKLAVVSGKLYAKDLVRTRVNLPLSSGMMEMEIPAFSADSLEDFLKKEGLRAEGGFLLVDIQNGITQTTLDAPFERSYFLDERFVKVTDPSQARYHFYVGVEPGNVLVSYVFAKAKAKAQKIVFVAQDELSFDFPEFLSEKVKSYELYEQKLFGGSLADLQIAAGDFRYFNTERTSTLQGLNFYEMRLPVLSLGMREYFEVGSKDENLFVGTWDRTNLEIPSHEFKNAVYNALGMNGIEGQCLIQLNLKKKIANLKVSGEDSRGPMDLREYYLDRSGDFSSEYSESTTQAFFLAHEQGVIDYRIDYTDGTTDLFQSYCSPSTYLVEQL